MLLLSSLIGNWERMYLGSHGNLAVFMFLFMICAIEVVILKMTTSSIFDRNDHNDYDDSSEYEEDIYYENLHNNYEHWARRRMRFRRQRQQLLQQYRQHFDGTYQQLQQQEQQQQ